MNYLMHFYLAGDDPEALVGNMMGDFVKGRLTEDYPPGIRRGIDMHRKTDSFAAGHPSFLLSKRRIDHYYGHYREILVDIFYDHFLAESWEKYSPVPFPEYTDHVYRVLAEYRGPMPERLRRIIPRMIASDWLLSYSDLAGVASVLQGISRRISRPNHLEEGISELTRSYHSLKEDFILFLPELERYVSGLYPA